MYQSLRTLIAAVAMAGCALLVASRYRPETIALNAPLLLFVVFVHAWVIAVGERSAMTSGGLRVPRFPLGGRVLHTKRPPVAPMFLFAVSAGFVSGAWGPGYVAPNLFVLGVALLVATIMSFEALRRWSKVLIPAALAIHALSTMAEFHTLGNLVDTASDWLRTLITGGIVAVIVAGPFIRTDVSGLSSGARVFALIAALPAYVGGFWIDVSFLGVSLDGISRIGLALLAGGLAQTLVVGLVLPVFGQSDRAHADVPLVNTTNVGLALLPMLLPLAVWMAMRTLVAGPVGGVPEWLAAAGMPDVPRDAWVGLYVVLAIVPLALGSVLVASGLDRVDGKGGRTAGFAAMGALAAWFAVGPEALAWLLASDGPLVGFASAVGIGGAGDGLVVDRSGAAAFAPLAMLPGADVAILGVPVADVCRAVTLMVGTCATLALRYLGYGRPRVRGMGWHLPVFLTMLFAGSAWFAAPYLGMLGPIVAATLVAALMLVVDVVFGQPAPEDDPRVLGQVAPQAGG